MTRKRHSKCFHGFSLTCSTKEVIKLFNRGNLIAIKLSNKGWMKLYEVIKLMLLQMLLRCCSIRISYIILRHFLYLQYLCPCLELGLYMPYLCDQFFFFIFILIMINSIILWKLTHLFCWLFLEYAILFFDNTVDEQCE